jgi:hypothetical protein
LTVETSNDDPLPDKPTETKLKLTIQKEVSGINTESKFHFTVTLKDSSGNPISGTYSSINFNNGTASINLKAGETVTIDNLPYGYSYSIQEDEYENYKTTIEKVNDGNGNITGESIDEDNRRISKAFVTEDTTIKYNNEFQYSGLVIKKIVENETDKDTEYEFTIKITGIEITKTIEAWIGKISYPLSFVDGEAKFKLKGGETLVIKIPATGYKYKIEEISTGKFVTTITTSTSSSTVYINEKTITNENPAINEVITYTNTYPSDMVPPMGIRVDTLPYIIILLLSAGVLIGYIIRRRIIKGR